jgi:response regulator of citrate/malate metabolism
VVSADIQPIAQERVMSMGAIAFVKKPISFDMLNTVLKQYGVI